MAACTYHVVFNKDNRKNKSGQYSLLLRVTLTRRSKYFNLGLKLEERFWLGKNNAWVKTTHPLAFEMNSVIQEKISSIQKFEMKQRLFNNSISLQVLEKFYYKGSDKNSFNEYAHEFVKNIRGKELNTLKVYNTFLKHLDEFNPSIPFNHLNEDLFHRFAKWLNTKKSLAGISVHKYFKPFRLACKQAIKDGYIEKDPFYGVSISDSVKPELSKKRVYLDVDEITKLKNAAIPDDKKYLEETRRHWLFCFYAGFYYSDLKGLKWSSIQNSEHGYCIVGDRYKNENSYIAPVHKFKHAVQILEEQKGKDPEYVFPGAISEQKFNDRLKDLALAAEINKNLMNKTARHSAIQFWESQGLGTQHVAKMVGHTRESTTQVYFNLSVRDINEQVHKFNFNTLDI